MCSKEIATTAAITAAAAATGGASLAATAAYTTAAVAVSAGTSEGKGPLGFLQPNIPKIKQPKKLDVSAKERRDRQLTLRRLQKGRPGPGRKSTVSTGVVPAGLKKTLGGE